MSDKIEVLDFGLTWALVKGSDAPPIDPRLHALLNENGVVYLHKSGGGHDGWIVSKDPDGGPNSQETIAIARKVRDATTSTEPSPVHVLWTHCTCAGPVPQRAEEEP